MHGDDFSSMEVRVDLCFSPFSAFSSFSSKKSTHRSSCPSPRKWSSTRSSAWRARAAGALTPNRVESRVLWRPFEYELALVSRAQAATRVPSPNRRARKSSRERTATPALSLSLSLSRCAFRTWRAVYASARFPKIQETPLPARPPVSFFRERKERTTVLATHDKRIRRANRSLDGRRLSRVLLLFFKFFLTFLCRLFLGLRGDDGSAAHLSLRRRAPDAPSHGVARFHSV